MMNNKISDRELSGVFPGWLMLGLQLIFAAFIIMLFISGFSGKEVSVTSITLAVIFSVIFFIMLSGYFILNPNEAVIATFFGDYVGTFKDAGFYYNNPLRHLTKASIKTNTHSTNILKVNDKNGNPIEVGAAVFWQVNDIAGSIFNVEHVEKFLNTQADSVLRNIIQAYSYDSDDHEISIKNSAPEISEKLEKELQARTLIAGIKIFEIKLTHIAYASEIAQSMLRKQQAEAVVAARKKIVEGALGMVENVLKDIEDKKLADFTNVDKVKLINNLMTVLVGENEAMPVINLDK